MGRGPRTKNKKKTVLWWMPLNHPAPPTERRCSTWCRPQWSCRPWCWCGVPDHVPALPNEIDPVFVKEPAYFSIFLEIFQQPLTLIVLEHRLEPEIWSEPAIRAKERAQEAARATKEKASSWMLISTLKCSKLEIKLINFHKTWYKSNTIRRIEGKRERTENDIYTLYCI